MSKLRVLAVALLFMACACAADSAKDAANAGNPAATAEEMLRPYLGRWRPTSFAEERNIVSLMISASRLSIETGRALTFSFVRQEGQAVVVRVTGHEPPNSGTSGALGLQLEQQTRTNRTTGKPSTREVLWIHWCDDVDQLSGRVEDWQCSRNQYVRLPAG